MSLPRLELSNQIVDRLNILSAILKTRSRNNRNDGSQTLEDIVARVFNALFGWRLENLNTKQNNYPGADLADRQRRISVQVTNNASSRKITDTLTQINKRKLSVDFSQLILFFLLPQKPVTPKSADIGNLGLKFDIWDISDVLRMISGASLQRLQSAAAILTEEMPVLGLPAKQAAGNSQTQTGPVLVAKFQEKNGKLRPIGAGKCPAYWMELWIEGAPPATNRVTIELLDESFRDNPWYVKRKKKAARDFLTDDLNSYGDVAILAQGSGLDGATLWTIESTLHQALLSYYRVRLINPIVVSALDQIRDN